MQNKPMLEKIVMKTIGNISTPKLEKKNTIHKHSKMYITFKEVIPIFLFKISNTEIKTDNTPLIM